MANYGTEVKVLTSLHNETVEAIAPHVTPPSKEYKQLILQQLVKKISKEMAKAKSSYGIIRQVIKEWQKDFPCVQQ